MARRSEHRLALDEPARLAPNDWSSTEIRMLECTGTAFRASCDVTIRAGAEITLEVPGIGPVKAFVTWRRPGQFAATFAEPIDLARAGFMAVNGEAILARLLKERARAHLGGRDQEERDLRSRIRDVLPMRTIGARG
jgi:hypothetical protein